MRIINLIENKSCNNTIKCEHGLSMLVQTKAFSVLCDVGQSDKLMDNAEQLGVDLSEVDYVVLSHGHYDHTGGLPAFLKINSKAKILVHSAAFKERFSKSDKMLKPNGVTWRNELEKFRNRIHFIDSTREVTAGLWVVSGLHHDDRFSALDKRLVYKEGDELLKDPFDDELIVVVREENKNALLTGCAHNGIVNIIHAVKKQLDVPHYDFIGGGLHLSSQPDDKIQHIIAELSKVGVERWGLNHCTGENAVHLFKKAFGAKVSYFRGGETIDL